MIFFGLLFWLVIPVIGSAIGMVILRLSYYLLGKFSGKAKSSGDESAEAEFAEFEPVEALPDLGQIETSNPYQAPQTRGQLTRNISGNLAVEIPGFGKAYLICLAASFIYIFLTIGIAIIGEVFRAWSISSAAIDTMLGLVALISGPLILAVMNKIMMPTSWKRATAATGLFFLDSIVIYLGIILVIFIVIQFA